MLTRRRRLQIRDDQSQAIAWLLFVASNRPGVGKTQLRRIAIVATADDMRRTIGTKPGTGGSDGADYLTSTLFRPAFPDLWAIRTQF